MCIHYKIYVRQDLYTYAIQSHVVQKVGIATDTTWTMFDYKSEFYIDLMELTVNHNIVFKLEVKPTDPM